MRAPSKILVANRAEIACRIFQTCHEMGLKTVGVFVEGDEDSRHLTFADEVHRVSSYLDIPSILEVVKKSQVDLVHPGYGFLSERPAFVDAVEKAGCVFVGPKADTMRQLGEKISAKELAAQVGVPILPWSRVSPGEDIAFEAKKVGYPLLIKASAGGGGKGMRKVNSSQELVSAAESASAEALAAFGDGTLFLERWVEHPRHIEVQVFGDGRGGGTHLYERECSLQRRHQKIWEEATAPHLSTKTREKLFSAAMRLLKASQYSNAGTLEFLMDQEENFYFLEMNTRLQVEHPTTEWVTGLDLVWAQIAQALAPRNTILSEPPSLNGHAIEVRIYAEDPAQDFIPTPGRVEQLRWPTGPGIRVDSGIEEGQVVGTQFDSLLAKLIVHARNRDQALQRLSFALDGTVILGLGTNQAYLQSLVKHPRVREGKVDTGFLDSEKQNLVLFPSPLEIGLISAVHDEVRRAPVSYSSEISGNRISESPSPWAAFGRRGLI